MNIAYKQIIRTEGLTIGLMSPLESYVGSVPTMIEQDALASQAEILGFQALWIRDIPLYDPNFGDVGQMYDPFTYLGYLSSMTSTIALGIASLILPFRHPIDLTKSILSINNLSKGRLLCGIATGDRPVEYFAYGKSFSERGKSFREILHTTKRLISEKFPEIKTENYSITHCDVLPKNMCGDVPFFVTGHSQQDVKWIAENSDGWLYYPQSPAYQQKRIQTWKDMIKALHLKDKPFLQSLYLDVDHDPDYKPKSIHLGYKIGRNYLLEHLKNLESIGVNHVILNFKYAQRDVRDILEELSAYILPHFKKS